MTLHPDTTATRVAAALSASAIASEINERRGTITDNAQTVIERRYLAKDPTGTITEDSDGMFRRVAHNLSQADCLYGADEDERQLTEDTFYDAIASLDLLPNSPTLMNAGRELQQLSACFVLPVPDTLDDIFDGVKHTALIHKSGGGTGFAFSRLRAEGSKVGSTGGVASGPVSFIRAFDTATDVVKQGGTRRGANMGILHVTHPDILKFIHCKDDGKNLLNFNISVAVTDDFMLKALAREEYQLLDPRDQTPVATLNAGDVYDQLIASAWKTGDPGLVFIDAINRTNPNPQLGTIESTNPCGEQPLLPYESCNLASINLSRMTKITPAQITLDEHRLRRTIAVAVHMLDNVIDMNQYPLPQVDDMTKNTRRIGLGVMGLADLLVQLGIRYDSEEALTVTGQIMATIQAETHNQSHALAEKRGTFPAWRDSAYGPTSNPDPKKMRNSAPTTVAPTGTISIIAAASSGIEPYFALAFERNVMDNTRMVESNPYLEAILRHENLHTPDLMATIAATGTLDDTPIPDWIKDLFPTSQEITPNWHVRMQAAVQAHVDNAVSKTINFPESATEDDIRTAYTLAFNLDCKGITVYRDASRQEQVLSTGRSQAQNGHQTQNGHQADDGHKLLRPRERPRKMKGITERLRTGHGNMYVTVNQDEEGIPFEVFGNLGKAGGCDSAQLEAITRLTTLCLRSGIDPDQIISQLSGITCCPSPDDGVFIKSSPDALALALHRATHNGDNPTSHTVQPALMPAAALAPRPTGPACPDCYTQVMISEGCQTCPSCGWSKCI